MTKQEEIREKCSRCGQEIPRVKCSSCGQEIPIKFCPLLETDCMKGNNLPCREYLSPECTNEPHDLNLDSPEKRCGTCKNTYRQQGGIKGITFMACNITGAMVLPIQSCYKPKKWWEAK